MRRTLFAALTLAFALPLFATDANPTAKQRALIDDLMKTMNIDRQINAMMDAVLGQMEKSLGATEADAETKLDLNRYRELMAKANLGTMMHDEYVRIYSKYFTEEELAQVVAFYHSPAGGKMIDTMPAIMREGAEAGERILGPKIEAIVRQVADEREKRHPERKTMADIRSIATAAEAYQTDEDRYPIGDWAVLKQALQPVYIKELPEKDGWGNAYAWVSDGKSYRVVSAGSDGIFDWDSRRIAEMKVQATERPEDDIIYADGEFVRKPKSVQ